MGVEILPYIQAFNTEAHMRFSIEYVEVAVAYYMLDTETAHGWATPVPLQVAVLGDGLQGCWRLDALNLERAVKGCNYWTGKPVPHYFTGSHLTPGKMAWSVHDVIIDIMDRGGVMVAHNARHDARALRTLFGSIVGVHRRDRLMEAIPMVDSLRIARAIHGAGRMRSIGDGGRVSASLAVIASWYGLCQPTPHDAAVDCKVLQVVCERMHKYRRGGWVPRPASSFL
jgi:hypothetical protein